MAKKPKLFSGKSFLVSLKGIGSSIVTGLTFIPFYILMFYFIGKEMLGISALVGITMFAWYLFFWGFIGRKFWDWK